MVTNAPPTTTSPSRMVEGVGSGGLEFAAADWRLGEADGPGRQLREVPSLPGTKRTKCSLSTAAVSGSSTTRRCWCVLVSFSCSFPSSPMYTVLRTVSTSWPRSICGQRSPQISPRRIPVVILTQTNEPQSGPKDQAWADRRAASSELGGFGSGWGIDGLCACWATFDGTQCHTTARSRAPLTIQCTPRIVESDRPRQTFRLHALAQARQPVGLAGAHDALDDRRTDAQHQFCAGCRAGGCSGLDIGAARRRTNRESRHRAAPMAASQAADGCAF